MKRKLLLLLSISVLLFTSSCSVFTRTSLSHATIGDKCYLNVKIFQALNSHEALAKGFENNSIVVKLITADDAFYDGKVLKGEYILVDTYTYESKLETTKTVPVFIKVSEYNAAKPLIEQIEKENEPKGQKL